MAPGDNTTINSDDWARSEDNISTDEENRQP